MTKSQITIRTHTAKSRGFTLVEMLVVAALIAIFAGLAVFNITAQLEREKSKAATAEARQIATAMSFAYDDLGFFPKIGLLRFNRDGIFDFLRGTGFDSAEYHGYAVGNQASRIEKKWRQNYLASSGPDKTVLMRFLSNGLQKELNWPADQWGNPYVGYFLKTIPAVGQEPPKHKFIETASDKANYAAAIVSYGRNRVPGLRDNPLAADLTDRNPLRLYFEGPLPREFRMYQPQDYNSDTLRADVFTGSSNDATFAKPYIRERLSDDRYYEF